MSMKLASCRGVPRWGLLTALSVGSAAAAMAIATPPALASDTSSLKLSATATPGVRGAALTITYSAPAKSPAVLSAATLGLPINWNSGLIPAVNTGAALGTMTITPPGSLPLVGQITATDENNSFADQPTIVATFPSSTSGGTTIPGFAISGALDLATHTVAFTGFPNMPFTSVVLSFSPGHTSPASIKCQTTPGTVSTTVAGQDGTSNQLSAPLIVNYCPPSASGGKLTGAGRGKPTLSFSLAGTDGAALTEFTAKLPVGLNFASNHVRRGVSISGGKVIAIHGFGHKLSVLLAAPTPKVTVEIRPSALRITKALQREIRQHKATSLSGRVAVGGGSSPLSLLKVT